MTVNVERKNNARKSSWDSKMSMSSMSTGTRTFRRSPSSILSCDSDIRFTRKKLTSQYKCGCCIIATFLVFLLLAAIAVYLGFTLFLPQSPEEQIFRATFRVVNGDFYTADLADPDTNKFKNKSRDYRERLNLLFRRSSIKRGYIGSEILALDGNENKDLVVHFNIHIDPGYVKVLAGDLQEILLNEISVKDSVFFNNLTVDKNSVEVTSEDLLQAMTSTEVVRTEAVTLKTAEPRKCSALQLEYCSKLGYNFTTYPNIFKHGNVEDVKNDVIAFRELVDAECYKHAYQFICRILQPVCKKSDKEDEMLLPCRSFCKEFLMNCGGRLQGKIKEYLDCDKFPEQVEGKQCITKPGCVEDFQSKALSPRICDGIVDCQDLSDELTCTYCNKNQLHCGIGRMCVPKNKRCDGKSDCPDGSDEKLCLNLAETIKDYKKTNRGLTPHLLRYSSKGHVIFNEKGEIGKLCTENINKSLPVNQTVAVLKSIATSLCKTLGYNKLSSFNTEIDIEVNTPYVRVKNPTSTEFSFVRTKCPSKQVLKVTCSDLECGTQGTHGYNGLKVLSKMATHGDWPWHVALHKEDVHICDGTLISPEWIATTSSCFQGQPKAEWTARFGTIRLSSATPWEQERRIVGMIKSPVEGSTVALIKLDRAIILNDFVRPVCLPSENFLLNLPKMHCNTLGWARNREQLQRVQVKVIDMEKCENVSISNVNSICTEPGLGQNDCNEEEFAGSPMVCQNHDDNRWILVGVTNWRIACTRNAPERPRMYDKISSNVNWITDSVAND